MLDSSCHIVSAIDRCQLIDRVLMSNEKVILTRCSSIMSELDPQLGGTQEKVLENLPTTDAGNCDSERDINDIFNDIALSEERISDEAYQEGFGEGELAGNIDGYHLGFHRGADIGTELGYYYGILSVQRKESTTFTERAIKAVDACMGLIDSYPRTNDEHVDLFAELEKIRSQYRKTFKRTKQHSPHIRIMLNKVSGDIVRNHLDKCLRFLTPYLPMANCHMVTFITDNLYERFVSHAIQSEMKSHSHFDEAMDIYWNHLRDEMEITQMNGFEHLHRHLADMREHSIDKLDSVWITPDVLKEAIGCKTNDLLNKIEGFMSPKKNHEVEVAADTVACICASASSNGENLYVVDAGGGKGYLSTHLALEYKIKVLGVDWNPDHTLNALNRSEKLVRVWNALKNQAEEKSTNPTLEKGGRRNRGKQNCKVIQTENIDAKRAPTVGDNYKTLTHFITSETNFLNLFREHFDIPHSMHFPGICLAGLHTCGDLGPSCLRIYNSSEHILSVCNIGCCYNLINEKYDTFTYPRIRRERDDRSRSPVRCEADVPLDKLNSFGFPMSQYLDEQKIRLGRNARMLSCQSINRIVARHEKPHNHLFYRALLEVLISKQFPQYEHLIEVGRMKTCLTFAEYTRKSSKRNVHINFDHMTDDDLNQFHADHIADEKKMNFFHMLRLSLATIIETVILLDRMLYLIEMDQSRCDDNSGGRQSYLVRFFDPVISPRCYGFVGMKF